MHQTYGKFRLIDIRLTLKSRRAEVACDVPLLIAPPSGNIILIGPDTLSMKSATALKDIYDHGSPLVKNQDFYSAFSAIPGLYNTHNVVNKKMHSRKRRVMAHAFSETALKDMEEVMITQLQRLCHHLEQGPKAMDMSQWFNYFTYDFMGGELISSLARCHSRNIRANYQLPELCFGKGFSMMSDKSSRYIMQMADKVSHASSIVRYFAPFSGKE